MTTWNYRVFREENDNYVIREVIYDDDEAIMAYTAEPIELNAQSFEELQREIELLQEALTLPVLSLIDMPATESRSSESPVQDRSKNTSLEQVLLELDLDEAEKTP